MTVSKSEQDFIVNIEEKRAWNWIRQIGLPVGSLNKALVNIERFTDTLTPKELTNSILAATAKGIQGLKTLPLQGRDSLLSLFCEAEAQIKPIVQYRHQGKPCLPITGLTVVHPLEIGQDVGLREGYLWLDAIQSLVLVSKLTENPLCQQYVEDFLSLLPRIQQI